MRQYHIGVIAPVTLPEPLSRAAAAASVCQALTTRGYKATLVPLSRDLVSDIKRTGVDVAFVVADWPGEDGSLAGLLSRIGIPYTGSSVLAAALAGDKVKTKEILRLNNLPTPPSFVVDSRKADPLDGIQDTFGLPAVVKPASGKASLGASVARDPSELARAIWAAGTYCRRVLVERYTEGQVITVGLLNGRVLGAVEVETRGPERILHFPARCRPTQYRGVLTLASRAVEALGVEGAATVDLILSDESNETILEVNTPADLSPQGLFAVIASGAGLGYEDLVERVLDAAESRMPNAESDAAWAANPAPEPVRTENTIGSY